MEAGGRLDDSALTETGAQVVRAAAPEGRTLLIACGALAREILALIRLNGWTHLDLTCLPAKLHNRPEQIPEAARDKIRAARQEGYASVKVVFADCGTGGLLDKVCAEEGVERIAGPHCYAFFEGVEAFERRTETEIDAFYLTDFLARQFDSLIWRGMGLENPIVREMMFTHYRKLIYLAQTDDVELSRRAEAAAERLGLVYERRFTGYGELSAFLES